MLSLPKPYLSYSSINLWLRSKDQFRRRYYEGEQLPQTPEMMFGREVHEQIENDGLPHVPRYSVSEKKIEVDIEGVPIMAYIDTFCPRYKRFREYKTGRERKDGSAPWDSVKVHAHDQLPFYSLLIQRKFGKVVKKTWLDWLEVRKSTRKETIGGITYEDGLYDLELTGRVESFERVIEQWERDRQVDIILKAAKEISDDWIEHGLQYAHKNLGITS